MGSRDNSVSINRTRHRDEKLERVEAELATARALIRKAISKKLLLNQTISPLEDADYVPQGDIYKNPYAFHWY